MLPLIVAFVALLAAPAVGAQCPVNCSFQNVDTACFKISYQCLPIPPGSGSRLPSMPTKKPTISTASGGAPPNARKQAHSTAIWSHETPIAKANNRNTWPKIY